MEFFNITQEDIGKTVLFTSPISRIVAEGQIVAVDSTYYPGSRKYRRTIHIKWDDCKDVAIYNEVDAPVFDKFSLKCSFKNDNPNKTFIERRNPCKECKECIEF